MVDAAPLVGGGRQLRTAQMPYLVLDLLAGGAVGRDGEHGGIISVAQHVAFDPGKLLLYLTLHNPCDARHRCTECLQHHARHGFVDAERTVVGVGADELADGGREEHDEEHHPFPCQEGHARGGRAERTAAVLAKHPPT